MEAGEIDKEHLIFRTTTAGFEQMHRQRALTRITEPSLLRLLSIDANGT